MHEERRKTKYCSIQNDGNKKILKRTYQIFIKVK